MKITEKIKTFSDVLHYHNMTTENFDTKCIGLEADEKAYLQIKLITTALNEGWTPDWEDSDQWKYYPWFWMNDSSAAGRF